MEFLNLDEISAPLRSIKLKGVEHPVKELNVDGFIDTMRDARELEKADPNDVAQQIELTIKQIQRSVPSLTRQDLGALRPAQIRAINQFLQGQLADGAQKATEDGDAEAPSEKKPD